MMGKRITRRKDSAVSDEKNPESPHPGDDAEGPREGESRGKGENKREAGSGRQPMGFRGSNDSSHDADPASPGGSGTGGSGSGTDGPGQDPADPLGALFGGQLPPELRQQLESMGLGQIDPYMMQMMQAQVQAMMSGSDDGNAVNIDVANDGARNVVAAAGDQSISETTRRDVEQVVQVANLWLDAVTDLAPPEGRVRALSRAEWVELSMPVWQQLTEPVAAGVAAAMTNAMQEQLRGLVMASCRNCLGFRRGWTRVRCSARWSRCSPA